MTYTPLNVNRGRSKVKSTSLGAVKGINILTAPEFTDDDFAQNLENYFQEGRGEIVKRLGQAPKIKIYKLNYDNQTLNFVDGEKVVGGTTGAQGIILKDIDNGTSGTLILANVTADYQNDEVLTGLIGGSAQVDGTNIVNDQAITMLERFTDNIWIIGFGTTVVYYLEDIDEVRLIKNDFPTSDPFRGVKYGDYFYFTNGSTVIQYVTFDFSDNLIDPAEWQITRFGERFVNSVGTTTQQVELISNTIFFARKFVPTSTERYPKNTYLNFLLGGTVTVEIQGDSSGDPDGVALVTDTKVVNPGWEVFDSDVELTAGTTYWIVVKSDASNASIYRFDDSITGQVRKTTNGGTSWSDFTTGLFDVILRGVATDGSSDDGSKLERLADLNRSSEAIYPFSSLSGVSIGDKVKVTYNNEIVRDWQTYTIDGPFDSRDVADGEGAGFQGPKEFTTFINNENDIEIEWTSSSSENILRQIAVSSYDNTTGKISTQSSIGDVSIANEIEDGSTIYRIVKVNSGTGEIWLDAPFPSSLSSTVDVVNYWARINRFILRKQLDDQLVSGQLTNSPFCKVITVYKDRLVAGNIRGDETNVKWAEQYTIDSTGVPFITWSSVNVPIYFTDPYGVRISDLGDVQEFTRLGTQLVTFFENGKSGIRIVLAGDSPNFTQDIQIDFQTPDSGGFRAISTSQGVFYVNESGLWQMFSGGRTNQPFSEQENNNSRILGEDFVQGIDFSNAHLIYHQEKELILVTCKDGASNDVVLWYNLENKSFGKITGWNVSRFMRISNAYYGADDTKTQVNTLLTGYDDDGANITTQFKRELTLGIDSLHALTHTLLKGFTSQNSSITISFDIYDKFGTLETDKLTLTLSNPSSGDLIEKFFKKRSKIREFSRIIMKIESDDKAPHKFNYFSLTTEPKGINNTNQNLT